MADPVSESTFWWVVSGASALVIAALGAVIGWTNRLFGVSGDDREEIWDEIRKNAEAHNHELSNLIDRINAVKDSYVRRDDMAEKFAILSSKFDEQAALIELVRNRIHDLSQVVTANRNYESGRKA